MNTIINYKLVRPGLATAGQPSDAHFDLLANAGYEHVINLAMPDHPASISTEPEIVSALGMKYHAIPVPFQAPEKSHLREFSLLLNSTFRDNRESVFIHCIANYRVSAFTCHYLVHCLGTDPEEAQTAVFNNWSPDAIWAAVFMWNSVL